MREYREEVVRRTVEPAVEPGVVVEEEVVEAHRVAPVVETTEVVETVPVAPRRTVRRFWQREPAVIRDVVSTEYYTAPSYAVDPTMSQFLRLSRWPSLS